MELFPYILIRITGLTFEVMNTLQIDMVYSSRIIRLKEDYEKLRINLMTITDKTIQNVKDYKTKRTLANFRKDIFNQRKLKINKLQKLILTEEDQVVVNDFLNQVAIFENMKQQLIKLEDEFDLFYQQRLKANRILLQDLSANKNLRKGILLSNQDFLKRLDKYRLSTPDLFRKKELQTERKLLQYVSRMATKTSPFGTFTSLSIPSATTTKSHVRLNNLIFAYLQELLLQFPSFYQQLALRLNPTVESNEAEVQYLYNVRNIESIQKIELNEIVNLIFSFTQTKNSFKYKNVFTFLQDHIEAAPDDIADYLNQLIQYGLIEWEWGISGIDTEWHVKLLKLIQEMKTFPFSKDLIALLNFLELSAKQYETAAEQNRLSLQTAAQEMLKQFCNFFIEKVGIKTGNSTINTQEFKGVQVADFFFKPEQIFFEDTTRAINRPFSEERMAPLLNKLNRLCRLMLDWQIPTLAHQIKLCFLQHYQQEASVSVLELYEKYFIETQEDTSLLIMPKKEAYALKNQLSAALKGTHQVWNIGLDQIEKIGRKIQDGGKPKKYNQHFGAMLQVFESDTKLMMFCDAVFTGYGKMLGRFLHLFDPKVITLQKEWNKILQGDKLWVENTDASYFNANLHPALLEYEMVVPGGHNNLTSKDQQIRLKDLLIKYSVAEDQLILIHKITGRKVNIFDFGFEALPSRSSMYQFLSAFGVERPSLVILTHFLDEVSREIHKNGVVVHNRITVDDSIVLQRKSWEFPLDADLGLIPKRETSEKESSYFIKINQWRLSNKIPAHVFVRIKSAVSAHKNAYKPQYINFDSPLFVTLFEKICSKETGIICVEEMLPKSDDLVSIEEQKFATEYIVQWKHI